MTDHPLTDEMCESICQNCNTWKSQNKIWFESMRAAYDKGYDKGRDDQLGQVIEWIKNEPLNEAELQMYRDHMLYFLKKAMRP